MGFFSTILGLCGFGIGISMGLVIGYFLFVYLQPNDVKVGFRFKPYEIRLITHKQIVVCFFRILKSNR